MSAERMLLVLCVGSGILLLVRAVLVSNNRWRVLAPAVALLLLAAYEFRMDQWEKTVRAPIRLDMLAEVPVALLLFVWGALALLLSRDKKKAKGMQEVNREGFIP